MTRAEFIKFNQARLAGSALPELGIMSPEQEDLIMRTKGIQGLLEYEPDKQKLLNYGVPGRYAYERRFGTRPGEYTTNEERMMLEQRSSPPMGPDWGFNDAVKVKRRDQYNAFMAGNAMASMAPTRGGVRGAKQAMKKPNPMLFNADPAKNAVNPGPVDYLLPPDETYLEYGG